MNLGGKFSSGFRFWFRFRCGLAFPRRRPPGRESGPFGGQRLGRLDRRQGRRPRGRRPLGHVRLSLGRRRRPGNHGRVCQGWLRRLGDAHLLFLREAGTAPKSTEGGRRTEREEAANRGDAADDDDDEELGVIPLLGIRRRRAREITREAEFVAGLVLVIAHGICLILSAAHGGPILAHPPRLGEPLLAIVAGPRHKVVVVVAGTSRVSRRGPDRVRGAGADARISIVPPLIHATVPMEQCVPSRSGTKRS